MSISLLAAEGFFVPDHKQPLSGSSQRNIDSVLFPTEANFAQRVGSHAGEYDVIFLTALVAIAGADSQPPMVGVPPQSSRDHSDLLVVGRDDTHIAILLIGEDLHHL